jgi:hypothetical protein
MDPSSNTNTCFTHPVVQVAMNLVFSLPIGYLAAAIFTTINPLIGAAFCVTTSVVSTIANTIFEKCFGQSLHPVVRGILSYGIGILAATAVMAVAGVVLTPLGVLTLAISSIAVGLLIGAAILAVAYCAGFCIRAVTS